MGETSKKNGDISSVFWKQKSGTYFPSPRGHFVFRSFDIYLKDKKVFK
jgi:hypothetical protein